jgi:ElaB/YqjD/DUF883 family membrane-anchored ribosome-binding protein
MAFGPALRIGKVSERSTREVVSAAQDVAERAGAYLQARMTRASAQAQDLAQDANARIERLTGQSIDAWLAQARSFVRERPLQAVAGTVALGYVLGKILVRGSR